MTFDVIIIDPPWQYNNRKTGGNHTSGAAQKYDTMSYQQLMDLAPKIREVMNKDSSYIFLWTTNSMISEALSLLAAYGFQYKTMLTWDKMKYGLGYWFRSQTEHCLFGIRGKKTTALKSKFRNIIREESREHSRKPCTFYGMVHQEFDAKKVLELFATKQHPSTQWTCIGKAITGNDISKDLYLLK